MIFRRPTYDFIVVGLGNPGAAYQNTRHNAGFMALDALAHELGAKTDKLRFEALTGEARTSGNRLFLMKPQTFMNLSGRAVAAAVRYFKLPPERVLVIFDDTALPFGTLRTRRDGSSGGHNGIKSLIAELGCENFPRVKIGIGEKQYPDLSDWVLSSFTPAERTAMQKIARDAALAALDFIILNGASNA